MGVKCIQSPDLFSELCVGASVPVSRLRSHPHACPHLERLDLLLPRGAGLLGWDLLLSV